MQENPIKIDTVIAYRLKPEDLPLYPLKVWIGKVVRVDKEEVLVEILESGYNGLRETVRFSQIVGIDC